jgi:hypothetical protein
MAITNEQLEQAIKAAEEAAAFVQSLKAQSRVDDLKKVKELIARHEFVPKDLSPELKTRGAAAKKVTPRKSVTRRKTK